MKTRIPSHFKCLLHTLSEVLLWIYYGFQKTDVGKYLPELCFLRQSIQKKHWYFLVSHSEHGCDFSFCIKSYPFCYLNTTVVATLIKKDVGRKRKHREIFSSVSFFMQSTAHFIQWLILNPLQWLAAVRLPELSLMSIPASIFKLLPLLLLSVL